MKKRFLIYSISLLLLWLLFVLYRALNGFSLISDEIFYFHQNIDFESKRIFFLNMVQFFEDKDFAKNMIISINMFALLVSYYFLSKINFNNYSATFFQLIYFSAISAYIFRDTMVLLIFVLFVYIIIKNKLISDIFYIKKLFSFNILLLLFLLFLMMDFRPQYTAFLILSWIGAIVAVRLSNYSILIFLIITTLGIYIYAELIMNSFFIYGITIADYLTARTERHDVELTLVNYLTGLVKHFFAPIPTSLFSRIFDSENWNMYGYLDDVYRLIYKSFIYFIFIYIIVNFHFIKKVFYKWKAEMYFLVIFSLSNAVLYTFFSFGGGHERIKIFSTVFLVFLYSAIKNLKSNNSKIYRKN
ncbi:MAG TPA: hypothetical protein EYG89_00025 [Bacteroidia bacterium]|nr:hypothetical protein [Bacteroidia bacterium]